MRHAPTSRNKGVLDVGRREQNRLAQHAFRQRRKAAEAAQQRRIRQLEGSVEEMSRMLVGLCDEIMAATEAGDLARRPRLMTMLRSSIARSLELAAPVVAAAADQDATPPEMGDGGDEERRHERRHEPAATPVPSQLLLSPPWPPSDDASAPFAMRLVETTLSRACLYLSGEVSIPAGDYQRAFGLSLRTHTQAELLAHMRWLLGPGRTALHESSGAAFRDPPQQQHGLVTAADVQEQLRGLGARDLDPDTMELRIGGRRGPDDVALGMVVRLRTSLLTATLAHAAVCLHQGPVYPHREVQKAVEASVVLARSF
ncbi:hypothetical protein B0I37DRAFT_367790 [Chaetomium sp. MPI-CAGE-AT-0009]|nr:hypothetical protein B0I37DRAFT_367790 [Chaetomium sp. MPI-CAGE-AT-0009]